MSYWTAYAVVYGSDMVRSKISGQAHIYESREEAEKAKPFKSATVVPVTIEFRPKSDWESVE